MKYIEDLEGTLTLYNRYFRCNLWKNKLFSYGHFKVGEGSLTIGGVLVKYFEDNYNLIYGISFCSPEDQFTKRVGRYRVIRHLDTKLSHKRGSCCIGQNLSNEKPAIVFKYAAQLHLDKMIQPPVWARNKCVKFRGNK